MEILKIVVIGLIGAISFLYLKSTGSELCGLLSLGTCILILLSTLSYVFSVINFFKDFATNTGISSSVLLLILKITAISYLISFSQTLCEDMGVSSIGVKIDFAGRVVIFVMAIPIYTNLFNILTNFIWLKNTLYFYYLYLQFFVI